MLHTQVLVAGAGPAGALLAYLLSSRGVETLLAERAVDFQREFRGEVMMPSGLAALRAAGVSLKGIPTAAPNRFTLWLGGRRVFDTRLAKGDAAPLIVSQPQLLEHLVLRAEQSGHCTFLRGAALRELQTNAGRVVGAVLSSREGRLRLQSRFLVGADGRASVVRRKQQLRVSTRDTPMDVVWCKLPWPEHLARGEAQAWLGAGHLVIALPAPDGLMQLACVIRKGSYGALGGTDIAPWVRRIAQLVDPELGAHLRAHDREFSRPFLLNALTDCVHDWATPGALLIGDAAHTMSPVGGQGLNIAMRDAVVAANHLVPALRGGASDAELDAAAGRVCAERRPEVDAVQRLAAWPPRVVMGSSSLHSLARRLLVLGSGTALRVPTGPFVRAFLHGVARVEFRV